MIHLPSRFIFLLSLLLGCSFNSAIVNAQDTRSIDLDRWIVGLASDSYTTREKSRRQLFQYAVESDSGFRQIIQLLRNDGGEHPDSATVAFSPSGSEPVDTGGGDSVRPESPEEDLELLLAKQRLRDDLWRHWREDAIDRFVYDPDFDTQTIDGWIPFSTHAGDTLQSRLVFAEALHRHPERVQAFADRSPGLLGQLNFEQLDRGDAASWALVLASACRAAPRTSESDLFRLAIVLRCAGLGPLPGKDHERAVVTVLMRSYLDRRDIDVRDRIVIAARYGCRDRLGRDCREVLEDRTQSPSRIVTALLAASAVYAEPGDVDQWIDDYRNDARVSHVWRSMAPPKSTHRTQVRDVALALRWHRDGIDPRARGFDVLVADPILVFQPYSLGFEDDHQRAIAHRAW